MSSQWLACLVSELFREFEEEVICLHLLKEAYARIFLDHEIQVITGGYAEQWSHRLNFSEAFDIPAFTVFFYYYL